MTVLPRDTGNRAFWTPVGISPALHFLVAYGVCCLAMVIWMPVRDGGITTLWTSRPDLIPGALLLILTSIGSRIRVIATPLPFALRFVASPKACRASRAIAPRTTGNAIGL